MADRRTWLYTSVPRMLPVNVPRCLMIITIDCMPYNHSSDQEEE